MTREEGPGTLADAAAAWVPPWNRHGAPGEGGPAGSGPTGSGPTGSGPTGSGPTDGEPADPLADDPGAEEAPVDQPLVEQPPVTETPENERPTGDMPDGGSLPTPADDEPGVPVDVPTPPTPDGAAAGMPAYGDQALFDLAGAQLADATLRGALEAILLVVDEPVADVILAQVLEQPTVRVTAALERIAADFSADGRGFELRRAAGGWRLYTRPEYAAYVERFVLDGQSVRLTQAALETLAVVAYKQPVTRSRVAAVRGVNCDGVLRTLVSRGLIEECGTEPESGAFLYCTTRVFLEKLGLDSIDDLPPLAPFLPDDVEGLADAAR